MMTTNTSNRAMHGLIVGHSHIYCLQHANKIPHSVIDADFIQLQERHEKKYSPTFFQGPEGLMLNEVLATDVRVLADAAVQAGRNPILVVSICGNQHNVLGLVKHPQLFDFVLSDYPDLLEHEACIIPLHAMKEVMRLQCEPAFKIALRLAKLLPPPYYWLEPPPIADESYILSHAREFEEAFDRCGITAAPIRLKLWRLQSYLNREFCLRNGWEYISTPEEAQDDQGFLAKEAWTYRDSVHGNEWYGRLLLEKMSSKYGEGNK